MNHDVECFSRFRRIDQAKMPIAISPGAADGRSETSRSNAPGARRAADQAIRIIGQRGYAGFGIQELAQRCQLTNAGLLYHFGSKDRLLIALLEDRDRRDAVASIVGLAGQRNSRGFARS
jgi:AcrR family transcriptional regulator